MEPVYNKRMKRRQTLSLTLGVCLCAYFSFHLLFGERGYLKYTSLSHRYEVSQMEYDKLKAEREALEARVVRMRPDTIELDLLEERVQVMLGMIPDDAYILTY